MDTAQAVRIALSQKLGDAARRFAKATDAEQPDAWKALVRASREFVTGGGLAPKKKSGHVFPFGEQKGTPIEDVGADELRRLVKSLEKSITDPARAYFRRGNEDLLHAVNEELRNR